MNVSTENSVLVPHLPTPHVFTGLVGLNKEFMNLTSTFQWRESKQDKIIQSLCRTVNLLKSNYQLFTQKDYMFHWNELSPVAKMKNECQVIKWRRNNCS